MDCDCAVLDDVVEIKPFAFFIVIAITASHTAIHATIYVWLCARVSIEFVQCFGVSIWSFKASFSMWFYVTITMTLFDVCACCCSCRSKEEEEDEEEGFAAWFDLTLMPLGQRNRRPWYFFHLNCIFGFTIVTHFNFDYGLNYSPSIMFNPLKIVSNPHVTFFNYDCHLTS